MVTVCLCTDFYHIATFGLFFCLLALGGKEYQYFVTIFFYLHEHNSQELLLKCDSLKISYVMDSSQIVYKIL